MAFVLAYRIEAYALVHLLPGKGCGALMFESEERAVSWAVMQIIQGGEITRQPEGWLYDDELFYSEAEVLNAWKQTLCRGEFLEVLPLALASNHPMSWSDLPIAPARHYTDADIVAANHAAAAAVRRAS